MAERPEQAVFNRVSNVLSLNNLFDVNLFGFRTGDSTETALLTEAATQSSVLILLDLAAAFHTINHQMLLSALSESGIPGTAPGSVPTYLAKPSRYLGRAKNPTLHRYAGLCSQPASLVHLYHFHRFLEPIDVP